MLHWFSFMAFACYRQDRKNTLFCCRGCKQINVVVENNKTDYLRTLARKFFNIDFFSENFTIERWWVSDVRNVKKWGVTDFVFKRTCPEEHLYLSKSGFVSEEGHSGCKSQNIAIRALKGHFLCQIWFKWTY